MSFATRKPQTKAENDANARTLRALVKQPENKTCADCKQNDTRWASWNLGCFLCIRCSGIHRSMGTHISRVKSIDLDMWTQEQMNSILKWGNRRANLYWEAHLKPGHIPPDSRIESFIRSKYESRRWALRVPIPADPAVLEGRGAAATAAPTPAAAPVSTPASVAATAPAPTRARSALEDLLGDDAPAAPAPTTVSVAPTAPTTTQATAAPAATPAAAPTSSSRGGGLFDLDWDEPAPVRTAQPAVPSSGMRKDDIMSLFTAPPPPPPAPSGLFDSFATARPSTEAQPPAQTDLFGSAPFSSTTTTTTTTTTSQATSRQPPTSVDIFHTQDVWNTGPAKQPPSDAFADIWGDFK